MLIKLRNLLNNSKEVEELTLTCEIKRILPKDFIKFDTEYYKYKDMFLATSDKKWFKCYREDVEKEIKELEQLGKSNEIMQLRGFCEGLRQYNEAFEKKYLQDMENMNSKLEELKEIQEKTVKELKEYIDNKIKA